MIGLLAAIQRRKIHLAVRGECSGQPENRSDDSRHLSSSRTLPVKNPNPNRNTVGVYQALQCSVADGSEHVGMQLGSLGKSSQERCLCDNTVSICTAWFQYTLASSLQWFVLSASYSASSLYRILPTDCA